MFWLELSKLSHGFIAYLFEFTLIIIIDLLLNALPILFFGSKLAAWTWGRLVVSPSVRNKWNMLILSWWFVGFNANNLSLWAYSALFHYFIVQVLWIFDHGASVVVWKCLGLQRFDRCLASDDGSFVKFSWVIFGLTFKWVDFIVWRFP